MSGRIRDSMLSLSSRRVLTQVKRQQATTRVTLIIHRNKNISTWKPSILARRYMVRTQKGYPPQLKGSNMHTKVFRSVRYPATGCSRLFLFPRGKVSLCDKGRSAAPRSRRFGEVFPIPPRSFPRWQVTLRVCLYRCVTLCLSLMNVSTGANKSVLNVAWCVCSFELFYCLYCSKAQRVLFVFDSHSLSSVFCIYYACRGSGAV